MDAQDQADWIAGSYNKIESRGNTVACQGRASSRSGTCLDFVDLYCALDQTGAFLLRRTVTVRAAGRGDVGFGSRFVVRPSQPGAMRDYDFFAPGIWYQDNHDLPPTALASNYAHRSFYFREDRLPLPVVMLRHKTSGLTLTISHKDPDPRTFLEEDDIRRVIDPRVRFGSLGVHCDDRPCLALVMPGSEGEMTYVFGAQPARRWAPRSHPVQVGFRQEYEVVIRLSHSGDYPAA
ncbi:MAG: hypothetical protein FJ388_25880, partial [Verrucomicrobia bacterium]|nr:hypothetical protein [Verrucomicrobiota bacterium]